jgi:hypothetical protein
MVKFKVRPVLIPMQTVHESEAVVETSSHHINGNPERTGRAELASDRGRHAQRILHAQFDLEDTDIWHWMRSLSMPLLGEFLSLCM